MRRRWQVERTAGVQFELRISAKTFESSCGLAIQSTQQGFSNAEVFDGTFPNVMGPAIQICCKKGRDTSSRLLTTALASLSSSAEWELVTAKHFMPARRAPRMPSFESSITTQSLGWIGAILLQRALSAVRAVKKTSGSG